MESFRAATRKILQAQSKRVFKKSKEPIDLSHRCFLLFLLLACFCAVDLLLAILSLTFVLGHVLVLSICVVAATKVSNPDVPGEWRALIIPFLCIFCASVDDVLVVTYSVLWSGSLGGFFLVFYLVKGALGFGAAWEAFKFYRIGLLSSVTTGKFYLNVVVLNKEEA